MKTYKLIKKYPGSFELGHLAILDESVKYYNLGTTTRSLEYIENNPEHWQEVCPDCLENINTCGIFPCKKKDYKILSLITNNKTILNSPFFSVKDLLKNQGCNIHSIKRLSDGEIFTIGDPIGNNEGSKLLDIKIKGFDIDSEYFVLTTSGRIKLSNVEHRKKPLFTTEDGVEIFEGDSFTLISLIDIEESTVDSEVIMKPYDIWEKCKFYELITNNSKNFLPFSTKKAAENYIKMNKPCLSLNDVLSITNKTSFVPEDFSKNLIKKELTKIVKQKLK